MTLDTIPVRRITVTDNEALLKMIMEREIHLPYSPSTLVTISTLRGLTDIPITIKKTAVEHDGNLKLVYRVSRRAK